MRALRFFPVVGLVATFLIGSAPLPSVALPDLAPVRPSALGRAPDPVIAVGGDIACNSGDGGTGACNQKATSDMLVNRGFAAVLPLGDEQYPDGALSAFQDFYDPTWGRVKGITHPTPGNHEYETTHAEGYYSYFGSAAGDPTRGYYSFNIGAYWHLISLNGNCDLVQGCGAGTPQDVWLRRDLKGNSRRCILAYWHQPRFSSGFHGSDDRYANFWNALYAAHADIVLNGHDHDYEKFRQMNPSGQADGQGIREFVVGTGGASLYSWGTIKSNSLMRQNSTFGILKLTLHPSSYGIEYVPESGSFRDSGSSKCH